MGGGTWTRDAFASYSTSKGMKVNSRGVIDANLSTQEMFTQRNIHPDLNPLNIVRECVDSAEHPNTIPVIIGFDVTGSMGQAAVEVAKKLSQIITELYSKYKDIEFCIMGIGDLYCDYAPIQISQFESDVRIAEHLDKVYMEGGGGGNGYESYSAAWYMGSRHTKLDCWKRGKKGIIITMGDEPLNPYLGRGKLSRLTGDGIEADIETDVIYKEAIDKFDIYHIAIDDKRTSYRWYESRVKESFGRYLDSNHLIESSLDSLASTIVQCIDNALSGESVVNTDNKANSDGMISW